MELIFEIVSYHRLSPEQSSKKSIKTSMSFGRSEDNEWHLPDPEKVVSGTHARVEKQQDAFYIYDLSTNGLYINRSVEALGKTKSHELVDGDLLTFGDYEVAVSVVNKQPINKAVEGFSRQIEFQEVQGISSKELLDGHSLSPVAKQVKMPVINNDLSDNFKLPQTIPAEWDVDFLAKNSNQAINEKSNLSSASLASHIESTSPEPLDAVSQLVSNKKSPLTESAMEAFFNGLGISKDILPANLSDKLLYEMGEGMQLMLMGLMESLRNRSNLRNEFRINQTTFQQQENNPLKFSASIDDVFQNLFLQRSTSFLPANKAITEAFNDTKKHDVALTAGTLGAIEGLLSQLDPIKIQTKDMTESLFDQIFPRQKQLGYWKLYQLLHKDINNEIASQGSSALSDDFVRAYDKKIKSL